MKQIPLAIGPEALPTFDTYLNSANAAAVAHLRALRTPSAPVYLWGPAGSGKSHLLRALVHERQGAGERAGCFDAADPAPWVFQDAWMLVVVDRCEQLDAERQQAAFSLFVEAADRGVQWAAAGRVRRSSRKGRSTGAASSWPTRSWTTCSRARRGTCRRRCSCSIAWTVLRCPASGM
jgi:DnaA-homolog protein